MKKPLRIFGIIAIVLIAMGFIGAYTLFLAFCIPFLPLRLIIWLIGIAFAACMVVVGISRIREIKKEDSDDYRKY